MTFKILFYYLIPASVLGEMKRNLVEKMMESLVDQHRKSRPTCQNVNASTASVTVNTELPASPLAQYPVAKLSYQGNVTNHLAEEFYRQHGVEEIEEALEKTFSKAPGLTLMTTHHCIRYANGMCLKNHPAYTGPLYLRNGDNTFRLEFDCKQCLMKIISV